LHAQPVTYLKELELFCQQIGPDPESGWVGGASGTGRAAEASPVCCRQQGLDEPPRLIPQHG
jgi:hypothetical protein